MYRRKNSYIMYLFIDMQYMGVLGCPEVMRLVTNVNASDYGYRRF